VHIVRGANKRAFRNIHDEIRAIQAKPARSPERGLIAWFPWLPTLVRRTFYRTVRRMPRWPEEVRWDGRLHFGGHVCPNLHLDKQQNLMV